MRSTTTPVMISVSAMTNRPLIGTWMMSVT